MDESPIPREHCLSMLRASRDSPFIKIITGIRGCGKSTLLKMFIDELKSSGVKDERIISMSFDSNSPIQTYSDLVEAVRSKIDDSEKTYLFFDDIQNVTEWERAVASFYLHKADIYITGSDSEMLSSELSTKLSGRCIELRIHTLSFSEYLSFREIKDNDRLLEDYIRFGGFPAVSLSVDRMPRQTKDFLDGIFDTVINRSVYGRHEIRNGTLLKNICMYLMKNIGSRISVRGIANYLTDKGMKTQPQTVNQYIGFLEEALLFSRAKIFSPKDRDYLRTSDKYYVSDVGLRNSLLTYRQDGFLSIIENVVYNELVYRYRNVAVCDVNGREIGFIADPLGKPSYYQVSLSIADSKTAERELRPLKATGDNYPKTVITYERYPLDDIDGIRIVQLKDWLME